MVSGLCAYTKTTVVMIAHICEYAKKKITELYTLSERILFYLTYISKAVKRTECRERLFGRGVEK